MRTFYQNHKLIIVFLLRALGIYLLWYILYNSWIYTNRGIDAFLIQHLIGSTSFILKTIGFSIFTKTDLIGIANSSGLIVSPPCDGLSLFVLFTGFIIAYPGRIKSKFVFIPIGLLAIILFMLAYVLATRDDSSNSNVLVNVNSNAKRQNTSAASTSPARPVSPASEPATGPVTQTSVPGSQTTVAQSPTKGKVDIVASVSGRNGAPAGVKNEKIYLLDEDVESILSSAGVAPIEGQSLTSSLGLSLVFPDRYGDFNRNAFLAIRRHIKYSGQTDSSGKVELNGVDPNGYYVFGMTRSGRGFTVWNSPVTVNIGENVLNLAPQTLTEISDPAG